MGDKAPDRTANTRQRGGHWEQVAEAFLNGRGIKTLKRNYQVRSGEIDLVMRDGDTLVFTEVRYRGNDGHGSGAESVTRAKQRRVISAAQRFLQSHPTEQFRPCRFDVISVGTREGRTLLNWIRNAFDAG